MCIGLMYTFTINKESLYLTFYCVYLGEVDYVDSKYQLTVDKAS